ncbi:Dormancy-associated 3 [Glycine soja]|uniref:Uncharacterized protein n=2 Tax=Glycine max TaxID=3847 RepID=A0A0R0ERV5_SOYBN|nr:dormancy-associated protein homolog 3-like isoform X1 [Glycine soja]KAH1195880.1 Dormancy-associated 3 [Glycine max]KAH1195881.1 Dormancy-associated 3 [Glycine max]|eukprot:XP_006604803.1 dormancy-associated protein homolog 3 isoform X1 [Glycine max]
MWAHTLSNPYLDVNADPCGHVKGSNFDHNRRFRSPLTPTSCSTFNALASLNMTSVGRSCISYSEIWSSLGSPYAGSAKIRLIHMGLLDHLWDDTVAGPRPENGLGKLRKHHTFTFRPSSGKETEGGSVRSYGDESSEEATRVTRSIMIVKPPGYQSGSPPVSPAGSTTPISPFSGKEEKIRFGFEEGRHQMRTRREGRTDQALLLLSMCEK